MSHPITHSSTRRRASRAAARALGLAVVLLIGGSPAAASEDAVAGSAALEGPTWRLVSLPGHDTGFLAAVSDGVTVQLSGGALQAFAGCNRMRGAYTVDGDRVTFGPMAGTLMACPPPLGDVENAVSRALTGTQRFAVAGDTLTLVSAAGETMTFPRQPPPRLDGTSWTVTGFNNGRQAVTSPLADTTLTLAFRDGRVYGDAGCNGFNASYTRDGERLTIGRVATTRKACAQKGVMEQERQFVAALESVTTWAIDHGMLDLHRADGERALTAKRREPAPGS